MNRTPHTAGAAAMQGTRQEPLRLPASGPIRAASAGVRELAVALRLELFKARHLRLLWVLLGILVLMVALNSAVSYQAYQDVRRYAAAEAREAPPGERGMRAMQQETLAVALRANLVMPSAYAGVTGIIYFPGLVLVAIAGASVVGGEFGWGTVHRQLARGRRRWVFVAAKLALVACLSAVGVAVGLVAGTVGGVWTSHLLGAWRPSAFTSGVWGHLAVMFGRLWAVLAVYGVSAAAAGFWFRSPGVGVAAALIYHFVEALVSSLIVQSRGWLADVRPYLLSNVTHSLAVDHNPFVAGIVHAARGGMEALKALEPHAAWPVLAVWAGLFVLLAFGSFLRRDLPV